MAAGLSSRRGLTRSADQMVLFQDSEDAPESETDYMPDQNGDMNVEPEKYLKKYEKALLLDYVQDINADLAEAFSACTTSEVLDVLEKCCEKDSLLTATVERDGGKAGRVGLFNGYDLLKRQGQEAFRSLWKAKRPKWIWVSLPCEATSQAQGLNELTEDGWWKSQRRKRRSRKLARIATVLLQEYINDGGEVAWEWPTGNGGWKFPDIEEFWSQQKNAEEIRLHGCQFGRKTSDGEFIKKPWRLNSTRRGTFQPMHRRCPGDHVHAQTLGMSELRKTALYSKEFCRVAARCMMSPCVPIWCMP